MGELAAVAQHASVQLVGQEHKKGLTASWRQPEFHPENVTETLKTKKTNRTNFGTVSCCESLG